MKVALISCFGYYEQRIQFVKEAFENSGHEIKIYFSDFDHINKSKIKNKMEGIEYIEALPYHRNMSLTRIYSHYKFSASVYKQICVDSPDLIYAIIPPNSLCRLLKKYKSYNKVKLIYDIYDLWPESFVNKMLEKVVYPFFSYWRSLRNNSLKAADFIVTECDLYQEILRDLIDSDKTKTIYLTKKREVGVTTSLNSMDVLHICYLGSINNIINTNLIKKFLVSLQKEKPIILDVIGKGETKESFMKELRCAGIKVLDHGSQYGENKKKILRQCHFGINMMVDTVQVGLTMKSVDYFEADLPLINNIKGDTWRLIDNNYVGFNVTDKTISEVAGNIASLSLEKYEMIRKNTNRVFDEKFSPRAFNEQFRTILDFANKSVRRKILILCNHEIVLYNFKKELVKNMKEEGYDVYISMPFNNSREYFDCEVNCNCIETKIDRRGINPIVDFKLIKFYRKLIKDTRPDLVYSLTIKPTIYGGLISRKYKIPYITNITGLGSAFQYDNLLRKFVIFMYKLALKNVHSCFFENKYNQNVFIHDAIINKNNGVVVNGAGVNLKEFIYVEPKRKKRITFGFIGRVMREKGIEEFLHCVEKLHECDVEFRVYGFCEEEYINRLKKLEAYENFHYYGFCNNIKDVYHELDCIVLPSYHEGMSNVLLEAAATGRILITSDIFGCKEAVIDGKNGFLVEKANADSLLIACKKALALTFEERIEFGLNSRKLMEKQFDRNKINAAYMNKINEVLDNERSGDAK